MTMTMSVGPSPCRFWLATAPTYSGDGNVAVSLGAATGLYQAIDTWSSRIGPPETTRRPTVADAFSEPTS